MPRCSIKIMSSSTAEAENTLTSYPQHKLWHHRLGYLGKETLRLASAACDGIPKLNRHPLFKCNDFVKVKFHKHKKCLYEKSSKPKPGELFQMDYGFVRGKKCSSAEIN